MNQFITEDGDMLNLSTVSLVEVVGKHVMASWPHSDTTLTLYRADSKQEAMSFIAELGKLHGAYTAAQVASGTGL